MGGTGTTGPGSSNATTADESGSLYRTENNFGSSSQVPGTTPSGAPGSTAKGVVAQTGGSTPDGGDGKNAGSGAAGGAIAAETSDTGNTSVAAGTALLGVIVVLAAAIGVLSRRALSRRTP